MLPKLNRLTKKKDFDEVFKSGKSIKSDFLLCRAVKNNLKESRFGFVVSKKISLKATVRNKIKRRLRKAVAGIMQQVKNPVDMVIVTLPGIEKKEYLEIEKVIKDSFKKLNV